MAKYQIEIVETLSRLEEVEAESIEQAREKVREQYDQGETILTADNANIAVQFNHIEG